MKSVRAGFGSGEEDLERVIRSEKLTDVTSRFSGLVEYVTGNFNRVAGIIIISFDGHSGFDKESRTFFRSQIREGRQIFYHAGMSNKETCVVMVSNPCGIEVLGWSVHVLLHEYAHHIQFAHAGFPYYVYKEEAPTWTPSFAKAYEVGPATGSASIDGLPLPSMQTVIQESNQSLSNIICEGLLRERSLASDAYRHYVYLAIPTDPSVLVPAHLRSSSMRRYHRRIDLRNYAEWAATVQLAYPHAPKRNLLAAFSSMRNFTVNLNKKYLDAAQVYERIFKLCKMTDFNSFKHPEKAVDYSKRILGMLNITIEKW